MRRATRQKCRTWSCCRWYLHSFSQAAFLCVLRSTPGAFKRDVLPFQEKLRFGRCQRPPREAKTKKQKWFGRERTSATEEVKREKKTQTTKAHTPEDRKIRGKKTRRPNKCPGIPRKIKKMIWLFWRNPRQESLAETRESLGEPRGERWESLGECWGAVASIGRVTRGPGGCWRRKGKVQKIQKSEDSSARHERQFLPLRAPLVDIS